VEISLEWLGDFVEVPALDVLTQRLASAGVEVEQVRDPASKVKGVVVALVELTEPHPNADRLRLCTVFDGQARHKVVCGAPNVVAGQRVPFAPLGASLPGGPLTPRTIRGVASEGMLCSKADLGLEQKSDGLWDLGQHAEVGTDALVAGHVGAALTLGITPNRPDLLSHVGVAREVAASTGKKMKSPTWRVAEKGPDVSALARVVVDDPAGCKRYVARVVRNVRIGPSPAWMVTRLEQAGMRSINNVVDATNYVLLELGQPLHAFDLARIEPESGLPTLHVRRARDNETLTTLDGTKVTLVADDLMIADARQALALAGVMGGADSEVKPGTTSILLESAYFDPTRVRRTARRHGFRTEASYRFERGADPGIVVKAIDRCAQLLSDHAGGEVAKGHIEVVHKLELTREVTLRLERVHRILGIEMSAETVAQLLEPLEIRVAGKNESSLRFVVPSFRPDITREIDLIEELVRRWGYEKVPERLPDTGGNYFFAPLSSDTRERARTVLRDAGCTETVTFGFGSPEQMKLLAPDAGEPLRILNPLGEELSALRTSLLPNLVGILGRNQRFGQKDVRIFEVGTVFQRREPAPDEDERDRELPRELLTAGVLVSGGRWAGRWYERGESVDFADLAGVVETLCESFTPPVPVERKPAPHPVLNPYCSATLELAGEPIGYAGQLLPQLCQKLDVLGPVYVAEVRLAPLARALRALGHRPLPRFPGTRRDIAVVARRDVPAETLRGFLAAHAGGKLGPSVVEQVRLFDVYTGKPIPETHVSLAFAIEYRSHERTLTDTEVGEAFAQVQDELKRHFEVEVRSAS
jgi:phenylalanyl-tRNA synthetase beta chain